MPLMLLPPPPMYVVMCQCVIPMSNTLYTKQTKWAKQELKNGNGPEVANNDVTRSHSAIS